VRRKATRRIEASNVRLQQRHFFRGAIMASVQPAFARSAFHQHMDPAAKATAMSLCDSVGTARLTASTCNEFAPVGGQPRWFEAMLRLYFVEIATETKLSNSAASWHNAWLRPMADADDAVERQGSVSVITMQQCAVGSEHSRTSRREINQSAAHAH